MATTAGAELVQLDIASAIDALQRPDQGACGCCNSGEWHDYAEALEQLLVVVARRLQVLRKAGS